MAIPDEAEPPQIAASSAHQEKLLLIIELEQLHPDDDRQGAIASNRMLL
jgi:hypothetical protein